MIAAPLLVIAGLVLLGLSALVRHGKTASGSALQAALKPKA